MLVIIIPATLNASRRGRSNASSPAMPSGSDLQTPPELGQHLQHGQTNKAFARASAGAGSPRTQGPEMRACQGYYSFGLCFSLNWVCSYFMRWRSGQRAGRIYAKWKELNKHSGYGHRRPDSPALHLFGSSGK